MAAPGPPRRSLIAITGLKHSGKSSITPRVARLLGLPSLDLDDEALKVMRERLPIPAGGANVRAYFAEYGAETFRRYESSTLSSLIEDRFNGILACGGGIVDNREAIELLERASVMVYLTAEFNILYERIIRGGVPPFLDPRDPFESFLNLARRRDAAYRERADIVVPVSNLTLSEAADVVSIAIKESEHARK